MAVTITSNGINYGTSGPSRAGAITGFSGGIQYAIWNDYVDAVLVNEDATIEPGYAYAFNGERYFKTTEYGDKRFFGFDSDTYGHMIGFRNEKIIKVPVAGFVLAYVDREYEPGTPLTCMKGGMLTKVKDEDLQTKPYIIVATYWKREKEKILTDGEKTVNVNGRHWVKVK